LPEFTGERVIPGVGDDDLFNEHLARYRFARHFLSRMGARGAALDAGCGTGYGTAQLAEIASAGWLVTGFDVSAEALAYAREAYGQTGVRFLQASCENLPFADGCLDLIAAFEVIEHLERWPEMLSEAGRVLKPSGILLVSTPNKAYYAESRGAAGPNPFHAHEFAYDEFSDALGAVFPHVSMWTQNHAAAIAFVPSANTCGVFDAPADRSPRTAHFFLAACSMSPIAEADAFAYLPAAGNVLRARERHITLLESELQQKSAWLSRMEREHAELNRAHGGLVTEIRESNLWAEGLNQALAKAHERVAVLQEEAAATNRRCQEHIGRLDREAAERLEWIGNLERQIAAGNNEIARLNSEASERLEWIGNLERQIAAGNNEIARLNAEASERLEWVRSLERQIASGSKEIARLNDERDGILVAFGERSRWGEEQERRAQEQQRRGEALDAELSVRTSELQAMTSALENEQRQMSEARERLALIERSRWIRIGRFFGAGPARGLPDFS
jgi:SAM-dependent methyltransferase